MKKILLASIVFTAMYTVASAQVDEKYTMAMQQKIAIIDTTRNPAELISLSAGFERIAAAEKTKWLPYYYAALAQVNAAYVGGQQAMKPETIDPLADKAEVYISKADALSPDNSEIYLVKKMIASLRMMADPMSRYMQYGPIAEEALQKAMKLNPENPRAYLLKAQDKFYTPEQFGGSKEEAKKLFETANTKYASFKPATPLDPTWGQNQVKYFLGQY